MQRAKPGEHALERAATGTGVLDDRDAVARRGQLLALGAHHHDAPHGGAQGGDGAREQRAALPCERRLGRAHPRGGAAREHDRDGGRGHPPIMLIGRPT